jgi:LCP family protein required for cell wall assembly
MALLTVLCLALSGAGGAAAYFFPVLVAGMRQTGQRVIVAPSRSPGVKSTPTSSAAPDAPFTVLLLGSDDDSKFKADRVLTQSMILVRVEPATKHVTMLSIPRDLWVPLSTGRSAKIDAAYEVGGAAAAIATVERNFDVHVDEYAWVGLKGLIKLIDLLGGIDLIVTNPVLDDFYPDDIDSAFLYGYKRIAVLPGAQHLDGSHALQYVRSRHNDLTGDFGRSARQQEVLLAMKAKASSLNATDLPDIADALKGEFKTSMGLDRVRSLLSVASGFDLANIKQIVLYVPAYTSYDQGPRYGGESVVLPHWPQILAVTRENFP